MAEDRIVKFCAQVDLRSISLVMTNCPPDRRGQGHVTSSFFGKWMLISRKRCKIEIYLQWKTNKKLYMAHKMAATVVTLNDFGGHSMVAGFSNAIRRTFVQHLHDLN